MSTGTSLGSRIVADDMRIQRLLSEAALVGGIYTMGYDECLVLTNDLWKREAGGIPQHCFLLASAFTPGEAPLAEDEEVILLRVVGPASLPTEAELVQVRSEAMREMVTSRGRQAAASAPAILDVLTRNEIQFSAIRAKVLGTFYDVHIGGTTFLSFGSDIESYYASSRYKVYKPYGNSLSAIVSYPDVTERELAERGPTDPPPKRVRIGTVRYSSSVRMRSREAAGPRSSAVPVRVNVADFVGLKTAVFGMTRLGKSNSMKTIATAVFQHAAETGERVGQLLFDPTAEYANPNVQGASLNGIGTEFVTIFRFGADGTQPGIRPLSSNFFENATIEVTWSIITAFLAPRSTSNYIQSFIAADVIGPENATDDRSAYNRAHKRRAALYATLIRAGFSTPNRFSASFVANNDIITEVNTRLAARDPQAAPFATVDNRGTLRVGAQRLILFWDCIWDAMDAIPRPGGANRGGAARGRGAANAAAIPPANNPFWDWIDSQLEAVLALYRGSVGSGFRILEPLRVYHSTARTDDYCEEIQQELEQGKIVIVDLSLGSETVLKFCSERIINYLLANAARRFAGGLEPHRIQVFIEEAHRLFNRDKMNVPVEADPYVRLAKEAAKYHIGLVYATQEVSVVDPYVLSNTSNWIVTHLNNQLEINELSRYYDFKDFGELILKAEDVGFARLKTKSGRYIIPVQIDLFDESKVQAARQAGLKLLGQQGGS